MQKEDQTYQVAEYDLKDLWPVAMLFVVVGIGVTYGLDVQTDVQADFVDLSTACGTNATGGSGGTILYTGCGAEYNASQNAINAVAKVPEKSVTLVTIVLASIIITVVASFFYMRAK